MSSTTPGPRKTSEGRSICPLARGLELFGDKWTLLVVRDLFSGVRRFRDFATAPERIPTNLLSDRLSRLTAHGLVEQIAMADGSQHLAYRLTAKGAALGPVLAAMRDWGLAWVPGTRASILTGGKRRSSHPAGAGARKRPDPSQG